MNNWVEIFQILSAPNKQTGEDLAENPAFILIDKDLRDTVEQLKFMEDGLASLLNQQQLAQAKAEKMQAFIEEYEVYASKALSKGDRHLALAIATKIAEAETACVRESKEAAQHQRKIELLKGSIKLCHQQKHRLKFQLDTLKAADNLQRAQEVVAARTDGNRKKHLTALDAIKHIEEKRARETAQIEAAKVLVNDLESTALRDKLRAAGILDPVDSAETVLKRISEKTKG